MLDVVLLNCKVESQQWDQHRNGCPLSTAVFPQRPHGRLCVFSPQDWERSSPLLPNSLLRPTRSTQEPVSSAPLNRREDVAHLHAGENHSRCLRPSEDRTREETWQEARRQSGIQKAERRHIQMVSRRTASLFSSSDVRGFCDRFQFERRGPGASRESSGPSAAWLGPEPAGPASPHSGPYRCLPDARHRPARARCLPPAS